MSFDIDKKEFYKTFAEIAADPPHGLDGGMEWAWSALDWTQQELRTRETENRKLRDVLEWVNTQCPGKCAGVCDEALREKPSPLEEARRENGSKQERAGVVAWLRAQSQLTLYEATPDDIADRIERGDHRPEVT
jgi:hypothetical protein